MEDKKDNLKKKAKLLKQYINSQYKERVAYNPDTGTIASVSVSKYLKMPEAFQKATGLEGLPFGNITSAYGATDVGKTTLLQVAIAEALKQNILPILVLTEHKFDFNRMSTFMGVNPEEIIVLHADNLEQGYAFLDKILRDIKAGVLTSEGEDGEDFEVDITDQDIFIFWDSIGNTVSESELEHDVEEWNKSMGKSAKAIKNLTKRVNLLLSKVRQRVGILFLNQSYQSMPTFGPSQEVPFGGSGVPYSSVLVLRLRRVGDLKMTIKGQDTIIGVETKLEVKKNHITHKRPISRVYIVASGILEADKKVLDNYKKKVMR